MAQKTWFITARRAASGPASGDKKRRPLEPRPTGRGRTRAPRHTSPPGRPSVASYGDAILPIPKKSWRPPPPKPASPGAVRPTIRFGRLNVGWLSTAGFTAPVSCPGRGAHRGRKPRGPRLETTSFGALWITQGRRPLPSSRAQRSGPINQGCRPRSRAAVPSPFANTAAPTRPFRSGAGRADPEPGPGSWSVFRDQGCERLDEPARVRPPTWSRLPSARHATPLPAYGQYSLSMPRRSPGDPGRVGRARDPVRRPANAVLRVVDRGVVPAAAPVSLARPARHRHRRATSRGWRPGGNGSRCRVRAGRQG